MSRSSTRCRSSLLAVALVVALAASAQAATLLYPTDDNLNPSVSGWKLLKRGSVGDGLQTSTTNTTTGPVSDTQVPVTVSAGGSQLKWLSEPVAAVTLAGIQSVSWKDAQQSSASVNSQFICWVYRYDESTDSLETGTGNKITMGAELTGSQADYSGSANPFWDPALADGDRIALVCYVDDAPSVTMASGTASFEYNQSATEYMSLQVAEDLADAPAASGLRVIDVLSELWGWLTPGNALAECVTQATLECDAPAWRCLNAATTERARKACRDAQQACARTASRTCLPPAPTPLPQTRGTRVDHP